MKNIHVVLIAVTASLLATAVGEAGTGRFVRTEPFQDQPVVSDNVTGLAWQGGPAGRSGGNCSAGSADWLNWQGAIAYCDALEWGGYSDWYLPNVTELRGIVDNHRVSPSIDTSVFPETPLSLFWSSSSYAADPSSAWHVYFVNGSVYNVDKGNGSNVRCVRSGP